VTKEYSIPTKDSDETATRKSEKENENGSGKY
jgi:hypothetical protein